MCPETFDLWVIAEWMHDGAPAHFSHAVRDVLSNTYHNRWIGRGLTAWPPRLPDVNPLDFYLWGQLKTFVYVAPVGNEEVLHHHIVVTCQDYLQLPWYLQMDLAVHDEMCRGMNWNLMDILSTCYKYKRTLSAMTNKLNVSTHADMNIC
jgi:hypothetical protein